VQLLPQHEPGIHARGHVLAGHIHPVVSIGQQYQRAIRCPCFWHQPQCTVLPAFGHFTGGYRVTPAKDDQVFVAGAERVIPVSPKAMSQSKHGYARAP